MGLLYSVSREAVRHLEAHHLLCPWDCFTVSVGRLWDKLRPITFCVHGTAFHYLSKINQAKHFISQTILKTLAISLSVFPYSTQWSLEFNISCAQVQQFHGWHRPQSYALLFAVLSFSLHWPVLMCPKRLFVVKVTVRLSLQVEWPNDWSVRMPEMWWYFVRKTAIHGLIITQAMTLVIQRAAETPDNF